MSRSKSEVGLIGEDLAGQFLKRKGFAILERNHRNRFGEIDIVGRAPNGTLVFVEVKTMTSEGGGEIGPEDQASRAKLEKMRKAAMMFAGYKQKLIREDRGWRIDLVAIVLTDPPTIRYYENVVN